MRKKIIAIGPQEIKLREAFTYIDLQHVHINEQHMVRSKSPAFEFKVATNGRPAFFQVKFTDINGKEYLLNTGTQGGVSIVPTSDNCTGTLYQVIIPPGVLPAGNVTLQIEGCRSDDLTDGNAWVKAFKSIFIHEV